MPNVVKGDRMSGLMSYLVGEGRANEHRDAHLVAGDPVAMAMHGTAQLAHDDALQIARILDQPRRSSGVEVSGGSVWHCSLSLRAEEGALSDEKWAEITQDFMDEMGFTDASGKSPARWVAVRHGVSKNGNDHVHIAASRVREDGTKVSIHLDQVRAQRTSRMLEAKHGLQLLESEMPERATRGVKAGEREASERRGAAEPARVSLARTVRGCATASTDEAEFVRRLRQAGLLVRPRFERGSSTDVVGYSVAHTPTRKSSDTTPIWFGGRSLGRDLSLVALRAEWSETATAAPEWTAAKQRQPAVGRGRDVGVPDATLWPKYTIEMHDLQAKLAAVPPTDRVTWARVARETSGTLAAWSKRVEQTPGPLAAAADSVAKSAQLRTRQATVSKPSVPRVSGAAMLLLQAGAPANGAIAYTVMMKQMLALTDALIGMHRAAGEARRAAELERGARAQLAAVAAKLPPVPTRAASQQPQTERAAEIPVEHRAASEALRIAQRGMPASTGTVTPPSASPEAAPQQPGRSYEGDRGRER
ncbi:relaxase/mobilization nuclease domain-containing protein [Plantibacter sp. CFBP 13570]|nr:relaxase/mobilization nuclease domain-containing protein [Plantibacter sp. CFBP 13570]